MSGNLIDGLPCVFRIRAGFKAEPVHTLFIDGVLVGSRAGVNRGLVGIDGGTNGLTELMRFTRVEGLADLCVAAFFLILRFVILVVHDYVGMMNG